MTKTECITIEVKVKISYNDSKEARDDTIRMAVYTVKEHDDCYGTGPHGSYEIRRTNKAKVVAGRK